MAGDGDWFWYAELLRKGTRLYQSLDFTQQPLFVLETAWFQTVFGESWIASKVPAFLHVIGLSAAMFALLSYSAWTPRQKAALLLGAFFVGIRPEWYRFDDYHVLTDCFIIFSAALALALNRTTRLKIQAWMVAGLGVFAGLAVTTRLNDGAALFCFSALLVISFARSARWLLLLAYAVSFAVTVLIIVALTGDSLVTWGVVSILQASSLKGGNAQFLLDPIRVLATASKYLWSSESLVVVATIAIALSWTFLIRSLPRYQKKTVPARLTLGIIAIGLCLFLLRAEIASGNLLYGLLAIWIFATYGLAIYLAIRFVLHVTISPTFVKWQRQELILFLPFILMLSTSLSSGGNFYDLFMPVAVLFLLVPIVQPFPFKSQQVRAFFVAIAAVMALSGLWYKAADPSSWISYQAAPMFVNRRIIRHPTYGPMIIDTTLLNYINRICTTVRDGRSDNQLLSIPFPYANYYCNIAPWHNFVQTWFDTSSKFVVDDLASQLEVAPPKWILYQRQIGTLDYHELTYNDGHRLPQHALDDYIMSKVDQGEWRVVDRQAYGTDSDWLLLNTRTQVSSSPNLLSNPTALEQLSGWRISNTLPIWSVDETKRQLVVSNHQGTSIESFIARETRFSRSGPVSISASIMSSGVNTYVGGFGYSVDLYDVTDGQIVGALGRTNANDPAHVFSFNSLVVKQHDYQLRFHFSATDGRVVFKNVRVTYLESAPTRVMAMSRNANLDTLDFARSNQWVVSLNNPKWSAEKTSPFDGRFEVRQIGAVAVETTLFHSISFKKTASVTVQVEIGAASLDASGGFGYIVDLFDQSSDKVVGSIGVPARVSPFRSYAFTSSVNSADTYRVRLRFQAASGDVQFSKVKVEYGSFPTPWAADPHDTVSNLAVQKGRSSNH